MKRNENRMRRGCLHPEKLMVKSLSLPAGTTQQSPSSSGLTVTITEGLRRDARNDKL